MEQRVSPQYIQTSLAASLTLGFQQGSFHRNAKLKGLNLLLHYEEGCLGKCHFCGLSKSRREGPKGKTFIRVDWPLYLLEEIIQRAKGKDQLHRVCISMITHPKALEDTLYVIQRLREDTDLYISVLISPTLIHQENSLDAMKKAGADRVGIAIDAATPELFDQLRGKGVGGPHRWDHYWKVVRNGYFCFWKILCGNPSHCRSGRNRERDGGDDSAEDRIWEPIPTSSPSFLRREARWRNIPHLLLANTGEFSLPAGLLTRAMGSANQMKFDEKGRLIDFGIDINPLIQMGEPFMTSGCPGRDGRVACNRPYGNERPSGPIRNFPFMPEKEDIEEIKKPVRITKFQVLTKYSSRLCPAFNG